MCGILSGWRRDGEFSEDHVASALSLMKNRGPDDKGYRAFDLSESNTLVLGHTRLSILDLSDAGHQPMSTSDDRYSIVYNGEIYNYKELRDELVVFGYHFSSDSDTEVLLVAWQHWGEKCLYRLEGMFSLVVFDRELNVLSCARDAFGIKPFLFLHDNTGFYCASDINALAELSEYRKKVCLQKAYDYLVHGNYDNDELSFFEGVNHLMPGKLMTFDLNSGEIIRNVKWHEFSGQVTNDLSFLEAKNAVRDRFLKNIKLHLRSDVPLGAALSGGIDSSAVVCAMRFLEPKADIHTFSYIAKGTPISEEKWVDFVNDHVDAIGHKVSVESSELMANIDDLIRLQGEPFGSTSIFAQYSVFKLAKENGVTVTLDGQGADEILAGYRGYPVQRMESLYQSGKLLELFRFANNWRKWPGRTLFESLKCLAAAIAPKRVRLALENSFVANLKPSWLNIDELSKNNIVFKSPVNEYPVNIVGRSLVSRLASSLQGNGLPRLLRHADRNAMRFSVESRVPFLTTSFADLTLGLPEEYLISVNGETKHIFREAMRGIVPDAILDRKDKIGFQTPENDWLVSEAPFFRKILEEGIKTQFFDKESLLREFDSMIAKNNFDAGVWRWINFTRWCQINDL